MWISGPLLAPVPAKEDDDECGNVEGEEDGASTRDMARNLCAAVVGQPSPRSRRLRMRELLHVDVRQ